MNVLSGQQHATVRGAVRPMASEARCSPEVCCVVQVVLPCRRQCLHAAQPQRAHHRLHFRCELQWSRWKSFTQADVSLKAPPGRHLEFKAGVLRVTVFQNSHFYLFHILYFYRRLFIFPLTSCCISFLWSFVFFLCYFFIWVFDLCLY